MKPSWLAAASLGCASVNRTRVDTAAGGFATLAALAPWEILKVAGLSEEHAWYIAGAMLGIAAIVAFAVRNATFAQRSFDLPPFRETFEVRRFLCAFALFAFAELALVGGVFVWLLASSS